MMTDETGSVKVGLAPGMMTPGNTILGCWYSRPLFIVFPGGLPVVVGWYPHVNADALL